MKLLAAVVLTGCLGVAHAQSSASYRLDELAIKSGGHPLQGTSLQSTGYRMEVDAIGDALHAPRLGASLYLIDVGLVHAYPPPGEVERIFFSDDNQTLAWSAESSTGSYDVYRSPLGALPFDYGACRVAGVIGESTTIDEIPEQGDVLCYLVSASNLRDEEGGVGAGRPHPVPCP